MPPRSEGPEIYGARTKVQILAKAKAMDADLGPQPEPGIDPARGDLRTEHGPRTRVFTDFSVITADP